MDHHLEQVQCHIDSEMEGTQDNLDATWRLVQEAMKQGQQGLIEIKYDAEQVRRNMEYFQRHF
jgi:hypothetical protein